jgi:hypothetical protein
MSVIVCDYCCTWIDIDFDESCNNCGHPHYPDVEGCYVDYWDLDYECLDLECDCPAALGVTYEDLERLQKGEVKYSELQKIYKKKKLKTLIDTFYG